MSANGYPGKNLYFNDVNLAGITGFIVSSINIYRSPNRVNHTYKIARQHGQKLVSQYFDQKEIIVRGQFALAGGLVAFEQARDTLLSYLNAVNTTLQTDISGAMRQYRQVYVDEVNIDDYKGGSANVVITFMANDPFGYDTSLSSLLTAQSVTTSPYTTSVSAVGTGPSTPAIFTVTISSYTLSGTSFQLQLANAATGQSFDTGAITVAPGYVLLVDGENQEATLNGSTLGFTGTFIDLAPGSNSLTITTPTTSARTLSVNLQYRKRYM